MTIKPDSGHRREVSSLHQTSSTPSSVPPSRTSLVASSPPIMQGGDARSSHSLSLPTARDRDPGMQSHSHSLEPSADDDDEAAPPPPPPGPVRRQTTKIFDDAAVTAGYDIVPLLEIDTLPRGGISFETQAVGRVQFGIPPETIKDSMVLGMEVPTVYIVPVERFCRELGHALGLNFAEFEFPAYFNYFVKRKRVQLVVDSLDAEQDVRTVFGETLLGPLQFRDHQHPCEYAEEDFDPTFPKTARPNFYKEFLNFRTAEPTSTELSTDTLLEFIHFQRDQQAYRSNKGSKAKLGVPPKPPAESIADLDSLDLTRSERTSEGDASSVPPMTNLRRNSTTDGHKIIAATDDEIGLKGPEKEEPLRGVRRNVSDDGKVLVQSSHQRKQSQSSESLQLSAAFDDRMASATGGVAPATMLNNASLLDKSLLLQTGRRDSTATAASDLTGDHGPRESRTTRASRLSTGSSFLAEFNYDFLDDANNLQDSHWMYSQAKWLGELATVYPPDATEEQKLNNSTARVEIFKMAGGTEYIVHDVDENNIIVGKARFSGTVRPPDEQSVKDLISPEGRQHHIDDVMEFEESRESNSNAASLVQTFHPPSFGVTVLGNSHGFDKNGNTSGYVLWVNGRGIMIDPPPYSSSALEREGIRPQTIIAIILTHCHADHDAGAFQKIMTGARVAIITTPTIYTSFIRKYSALSGLSPSLLKQSHRFRPAIIGQPLKMQGAVFHFTYTLHTIPCISFKVEWRGHSIVFTGDHMNIPEQLTKLEEKGTLSKGRADDLRGLPLQDCDILLHEAGAPPIHTPLHVLQELPQEVRDRLYIVHTAAIPKDSGLRVAPTGTAGTLRLDKSRIVNDKKHSNLSPEISTESLQDGAGKAFSALGDFDPSSMETLTNKLAGKAGSSGVPPLVLTRPTDVSDAWFILNLLSAVPFMASLSYAHTMEVLEIASVEVFCDGEVVIPGYRRQEFLCVFWEGACKEESQSTNEYTTNFVSHTPCIWHAGDWTGPVSLQPDADKCDRVFPGEEEPRDIVAASKQGVKVILLLMKELNRILKRGSKYFRKYVSIEQHQNRRTSETFHRTSLDYSHESVMDVLQFNSVFGTVRPRQKRHLESLAEGPRHFPYQSLLWKVGDPVDFAYVIVSGTATIGKKPARVRANPSRRGSTGAISPLLISIEEKGLERQGVAPMSSVEEDKLLQNVQPNSEYSRLETVLHLRMEEVEDDYMMSRNNSSLDSAAAQRDKFANKVLARLYSRHAFTEHLIFSRGNFLCDTSRMVSGSLANTNATGSRSSIGNAPSDHYHTSNLIAGHDGCVVYAFPRASLVPFLDSNPGILLCLLGSQVVV